MPKQILIKNGKVVDGTGNNSVNCDVLIQDDKIIKVDCNIEPTEDTKVINAEGKIVTPGLIDPHVHEEGVCFADGTYELFLRQGVTTVVNGNCGHSIVPGPKNNIIEYYFGNGLYSQRQRESYKNLFPDWNDFEGYSKAVMQKGTNINFVTLLGHGTIRWSVMNGAKPRKPNDIEKQEIEKILNTNLSQGAFGLSFGLDYVPSRYADIEELTEAAEIVKKYDGVIAAHLRQSAGLKTATEEFLEVGRRSNAKVQISHLSATCPEAFELIKKAVEEENMRVLVDTIPRSTGHLMSKIRLMLFISAISDELFTAGVKGVKAALKTQKGRDTIEKDAFIISGDKSNKYVVLSDDKSLEGKSVLEIANERGVNPDECMLDLIADENNYTFWLGGASRPDFPKEGHPASVVNNPYVCAGSDEIMGDLKDPFDWYELQRRGCMPIFIQMYLEKGVPIEEIIRRNTSIVAEHFGINKRGCIKEGYFADIAVIDIDNYKFPSPEEVDYHNPLTVASGIENLIVNGKFAVKNGQIKTPMAGRVLKKNSDN